MSICFTCYATQRTANCVALAILIGKIGTTNWLMIYMPTQVIPASVFASLHSRAPGQSSTSGTEVWLYSFGCITSPATRDCLSWHWIYHGVSCLSSLCWTIILAAWRSDSKKTESTKVSLCMNCHILHWTQSTVNWSVTCFWYCRTAEDTLQRLRFWLYLTYLMSSLVVPH